MADTRLKYDASTAMGQIMQEGIDHLQIARGKLERVAQAVTLMGAEGAAAEMGIDSASYTNFRNRLNDLNTGLQSDPINKIIPLFDQG